MYKIGVISDTHGILRDNVINVLQTCDVVLHGGDINTPEIITRLGDTAPLYAVRGNADKEWAEGIPKSLSIELFGIRIFMIHNKKLIQEDISDRDIIIYGHSHKYEEFVKDGQTWLNPGSCGARRFSLPVTMAVISAAGNGAYEIERIDFAAAAGSAASAKDMKDIVIRVMKETDKGKPVETIAKNCRISKELAAQICRLYLTHPGVSPDGILGKMGL